MILIPDLGIQISLSDQINTAGFNPFLANKLLEGINSRRYRVGRDSLWNKVPALMQRPVMDHVEIVLSNVSPQTIQYLKKAEYGDFSHRPEPIVRQTCSMIREQALNLYKSFSGVNNEAFGL